jgi:hypothetical protein
MAQYTVYNLETDVIAKIHGGSIPDFQRAFDEGRRNMLASVKPPELVRSAYMEQALYDQVTKYAVPDDLSYDNILEVTKLSAYRTVDTLQHPLELVYRKQFDQKRRNSRNVINITNENGVKYAQIYHPKGLKECQNTVLNDFDSLSKNGTWNVGGNVTNLRLDALNHVTKHASLKFDINSSSTTGFIQNFTMETVDIADYLNVGAGFSWLSLPIPKEMIAVQITMGSNQTDLTTDYYTATVNQPHDNNEFVTGWNLLKYMLNNLTSVGNPNPKAIGFIRFDFTTTGEPIPNCNIDALVVRKGAVYYMLYNSQYCIIDPVTRAWKQRTDNPGDILPVEEDTYSILMLEVALAVQQEMYGNNFGASSDVTAIRGELASRYAQYRLNHTDETLEPTESSYVLGTMYDGYTADAVDNEWANDNDGGAMENVDNNNNFNN